MREITVNFEGSGHQYAVSIKQTSKKRYTVTYGLQVRTGLSYSEAAKELGLCLMHSMACESLIEPSED